MNKELIRKWVDRLRSGEFKQGHSLLRYVDKRGDERLCCLGVACEIAVEEGIIPPGEWVDDDIDVSAKHKYQGHAGAFPPPSVIRAFYDIENVQDMGGVWYVEQTEEILAAIADKNEYTENSTAGHVQLTYLNDVANFTFEQIADCIEATFLTEDAKELVSV